MSSRNRHYVSPATAALGAAMAVSQPAPAQSKFLYLAGRAEAADDLRRARGDPTCTGRGRVGHSLKRRASIGPVVALELEDRRTSHGCRIQTVMLFRRWRRPILAMAMLLLLPGTAVSGTLTPFDKNIEALHTFGVATASILVAHAGVEPAVLGYSGTVSDAGWTLHIQGSYGLLDLDLSFAGIFDINQNTGTFSVIDDVGGSIWDGGGSWSFTSLDAATDGFEWFYATTIESLTLRDVQHTIVPDDFFSYRIICAPDPDDPNVENCVNQGFYVNTIGGVPDSEVKEANSVFQRPRLGSPANFKTSFELPDDHVRLTGTVNFETGSVAGSIAVPEPSTFTLLAGGLLLFLTRKRRRSHRPD